MSGKTMGGSAHERDALLQAAIDFIGTLTGMTPPPIEVAPPEVFAPFRAFVDRVQAITALTTAAAVPAAEPYIWGYAVRNPKEPASPVRIVETKDHADRVAIYLYEAEIIPLADARSLAAAPKAEPVPAASEVEWAERMAALEEQSGGTFSAGVPAGEYPPLPAPFIGVQDRPWGGHEEVIRSAIGEDGVVSCYTEDQMRTYVDADRAMRAQAAPHITQPYTLAEIKAKIASGSYSAELLLQHAMLLLDKPAAVVGPAQMAPSSFVNAAGIKASDMPGTVVRKLDAAFHDAVTFADAPAQAAPQPAAPQEDAHNFAICQHFDNWLLSMGAYVTSHSEDADGPLAPAMNWIASVKALIEQAQQAVPAAPQGNGGTAIGHLGQRTIFDAIRAAYDLGYSDARNSRTIPGDSAPGYKGRNVEVDHGGALIARLNVLASRHQQAAPVAQGDAWRDLLWQIADALECTPCTADEVLPKVLTIAEEAARYRWLRDVATDSDEVARNLLNGTYSWDSALADAAIDAARSKQEGSAA